MDNRFSKPVFLLLLLVCAGNLFGCGNGSDVVENEQDREIINVVADENVGQERINNGKNSTDKVSQILNWIPEDLRKIDSSVSIEPSKGKIILSSILSNDKNKIVYTEIDECFQYVQDSDQGQYEDFNPCENSQWFDYNVYIKDLEKKPQKNCMIITTIRKK